MIILSITLKLTIIVAQMATTVIAEFEDVSTRLPKRLITAKAKAIKEINNIVVFFFIALSFLH
jgi:hypothetical protein